MMHGFINVLKPAGMTSHDVVGFLRRMTCQKRVGHTGTLDPGAVGVLPVAVGLATRLVEYVTGQKKVYRAEVTLGSATDSGDAFGNMIFSAPAVNLTEEDVEKVLANFKGIIEQVPPMTSAIKVQGQKLYELARRGIEVERPVRKVEIYDIKPVKWDLHAARPHFLMDVSCSKGTYIRSLCHDIGNVLGCGAYMSFLIRTAVGDFSLKNALTLEELRRYAEEENLSARIIPMAEAISQMPRLEIDADQARQIGCGVTITADFDPHVRVAMDELQLLHKGVLMAIGKVTEEIDSGRYFVKPCKVFPRSE